MRNYNRLLDLLQVHSSRREEATRLLNLRADGALRPADAMRLVEVLGVSYEHRNEAAQLLIDPDLGLSDLRHEIEDRRTFESAAAAGAGLPAPRGPKAHREMEEQVHDTLDFNHDPPVIKSPPPPEDPKKVSPRPDISVGGKGGAKRLTDPHLKTALRAAQTIYSYMGNARGGADDDIDLAEAVRSIVEAGRDEARLAEVVRELGQDVDSGTDVDGFLDELKEVDRDHVKRFVGTLLSAVESWWEAREVRGGAEFKAGINVFGVEAGVSTGKVSEN